MLSTVLPLAILRTLIRAAGVTLMVITMAGCAARGGDGDASLQRLDWSQTRPFGVGSAFDPPSYGRLVTARAPLGALRCGNSATHPFGVHLELFAANRALRVPAGIGLAPPRRRAGGWVLSAACAYPLHTVEPTGVVEVDPAAASANVGMLFEIWGQPLDQHHLAGFGAQTTSVAAFVDGRPWTGDPREIPLRRHAQIVLELGPPVSPHPSYRFAPNL